MKQIIIIILSVLALAFNHLKAQDCLLDQKPKQDLVQDYANIINDDEESFLRQKLQAFNDTTSTQILVVTVTDLCGYDKAEFTYSLGEKWGVGQQGKNNGIVIMVKPKEIDGRGETFIAPGYGLEGVVPDAIAKRIVDNEMIPYFKSKEYYYGIHQAVNVLMSLTSGEFTADEYSKTDLSKFIIPIAFIILLFLMVFFITAKKAKDYSIGHNIPFWTAFMLMNNSGRNHGGSWGNFNSGGGGFSGFGGGSFGGGGAGGSW
ncbi:MAG: YgcG family protein [Flavobacteriales bacterium]